MTTAVALPRRSPPDPRLLQRCLLLAVLLHIWLVLVFGNASGTAAPGQGVWGSLTVKLLGRSGSAADAPPNDRNTPDAGGQRGPAQPATETGAAKLGRPNPQEVAPEAARTDEPSVAPPSTATLELPEGFKPVERENLATPPRAAPLQTPSAELPPPVSRLETRPETAVAPLPSAANLRTPNRPAELPTLPTELPSAVRRLDVEPAPATPALPRPAELRSQPAPAIMTPSVELPSAVRRLEAPTDAGPSPSIQRPTELRALPAPATPATTPSVDLPAPVRRLEAAPESGSASPSLPRPAELRTATPSATQQTAPSAALPSAVQRLEAPAAPSGAVTLTRPSELRAPAAATTTATPSLTAQDLPTAVRRLESADSGGTVTPLQPATSPRAATTAPGAAAMNELSGALPGEVAAPAGPARGDPNANPYAAPKASAGSPDAGSRLGPDLPTPPTAAASAPRQPLNLSLPRGDIAARRGPGLVDMLPQPPERKSKLEQSIEDAANKDCRKAYANAGILAALPLAIDAARGKGCKW